MNTIREVFGAVKTLLTETKEEKARRVAFCRAMDGRVLRSPLRQAFSAVLGR